MVSSKHGKPPTCLPQPGILPSVDTGSIPRLRGLTERVLRAAWFAFLDGAVLYAASVHGLPGVGMPPSNTPVGPASVPPDAPPDRRDGARKHVHPFRARTMESTTGEPVTGEPRQRAAPVAGQ